MATRGCVWVEELSKEDLFVRSQGDPRRWPRSIHVSNVSSHEVRASSIPRCSPSSFSTSSTTSLTTTFSSVLPDITHLTQHPRALPPAPPSTLPTPLLFPPTHTNAPFVLLLPLHSSPFHNPPQITQPPPTPQTPPLSPKNLPLPSPPLTPLPKNNPPPHHCPSSSLPRHNTRNNSPPGKKHNTPIKNPTSASKTHHSPKKHLPPSPRQKPNTRQTKKPTHPPPPPFPNSSSSLKKKHLSSPPLRCPSQEPPRTTAPSQEHPLLSLSPSPTLQEQHLPRTLPLLPSSQEQTLTQNHTPAKNHTPVKTATSQRQPLRKRPLFRPPCSRKKKKHNHQNTQKHPETRSSPPPPKNNKHYPKQELPLPPSKTKKITKQLNLKQRQTLPKKPYNTHNTPNNAPNPHLTQKNVWSSERWTLSLLSPHSKKHCFSPQS